jgi:tetratricopeptide (TPR) repeat protein
MRLFRKPKQEHAHSRYMCVSVNVIEVLQHAFFDGLDLGRVVPDIDADMAAVIVAESLEADRVWNLPPERFLSDAKKGPMSDFKRAIMAEIAFGVEEVSHKKGDKEEAATWWAIAMASLEETLRSPFASPMLWYEDIFWDLAQAARGGTSDGDWEAIDWFKRSLAHNLHHNDGDNAVSILRDLAIVYLSAGELDTGLRMLATLLRHDPADVWIYNVMAISFDEYGLIELGTEATLRGLELLNAQGDPEELRNQLNNCLKRMEASENRGREAEVAPEALADLQAALALNFDTGQPRPPDVLCHELVPDLDEVPVKRPMRPSDIPLPDRRSPAPRRAEPKPPEKKPGRNDPCWCDSGKKYKYCHLRQDQKHER